jgi:hypothetical protein
VVLPGGAPARRGGSPRDTRTVARADSLSREEFIGISGWQSLMAPQWYRVLGLGSLRLVRTAWWGAAPIGKPLVALAKRRLAGANDLREVLDASMTLAVIGLRHASLRAETCRAVTAPRQYAGRGSDRA